MVPSLWSLRAISERTTTGSEGQRVTRNADKLQNVALGTAPADLVVPNGRVLLPESRRIVDREIAVETDRIAAVTTDASDVTGPETTVVDAEEKVIAPGFVNAHVHVDSFQPFERAYHRVLATGTTAVVTEVCEFGSCFGEPGVRQLLEATAALPIRVFGTVPPQAFLDAFSVGYDQFDDTDREELSALLREDRIVGIGEIPWIQLVGRSSPAESLAARARALGKTVSGHGAGCSGRRLTALAATITDDHEMVSSEEVAERLENGIHSIGRYGTFRDDIDALADAYERFGSAELSLSTDWIWPTDIVTEGYMDAVVRRAIEAELTRSTPFEWRRSTPHVTSVFPISARCLPVREPISSFSTISKMSPSRRLSAAAKSWSTAARRSSSPARTPRVVPRFDLTVAGRRGVASPDGRRFRRDRQSDPLRGRNSDQRGDRRTGDCRRGIRRDAGPRRAQGRALRSLAEWSRGWLYRIPLRFRTRGGRGRDVPYVADPGVIAVGADEDAMRRSIADVIEIGGGWAVRGHETTRVTFPTPIGARCADRDISETAEKMADVSSALRELGARLEEPALILQALSFTGVPSLRMSFSGYEDVFARETVSTDPAT